jgi:hypothetical protein
MKECHICFKTCKEGALQINVRENRRDNQKWTMQEKLATKRRKTKQKHNTICVGHHYTSPNTNNVNKTWFLLQTANCQGNYHLSNKEIFFKSIVVFVIANYRYYKLITSNNRQLMRVQIVNIRHNRLNKIQLPL